jgi:hypothetical protein
MKNYILGIQVFLIAHNDWTVNNEVEGHVKSSCRDPALADTPVSARAVENLVIIICIPINILQHETPQRAYNEIDKVVRTDGAFANGDFREANPIIRGNGRVGTRR